QEGRPHGSGSASRPSAQRHARLAWCGWSVRASALCRSGSLSLRAVAASAAVRQIRLRRRETGGRSSEFTTAEGSLRDTKRLQGRGGVGPARQNSPGEQRRASQQPCLKGGAKDGNT